MKKRIEVIASIETFDNLSSFKDIEDLNIAVRTYRDLIRSSVKRVDVKTRLIALLEVLKRHSCKYVGVSFLCKNSIASMLEVSYKTVQRLMKKLEELGMIKQIEMKRKSDMLQTANAVIIKPVKEEVSNKTCPKSPKKCPTNKTIYKPLKQKINNTRKDTLVKSSNSIKDVNFIGHWVPGRFASLVSCFYPNTKTVEEFWRVVKQCNRVVNHSTGERAFTKDQELFIGIKAIKAFVMKVKSGVQMKKGIFAYFNGIVNKLMDKLFFDVDFMGSADPHYN